MHGRSVGFVVDAEGSAELGGAFGHRRQADARVSRSRGRTGPTTVVFNGVAAPLSSGAGSSPRSLPVRPAQRTIVVVEPVCPRKGQVDLLPALIEAVVRRDDLDVLFVGRSWRRPEMVRLHTAEQLLAAQVALVVDRLVEPDPRYEAVVGHCIFRKTAE